MLSSTNKTSSAGNGYTWCTTLRAGSWTHLQKWVFVILKLVLFKFGCVVFLFCFFSFSSRALPQTERKWKGFEKRKWGPSVRSRGRFQFWGGGGVGRRECYSKPNQKAFLVHIVLLIITLTRPRLWWSLNKRAGKQFWFSSLAVFPFGCKSNRSMFLQWLSQGTPGRNWSGGYLCFFINIPKSAL